MSYSKQMLLTGAGFTANLGTPVASQLHNLICNHPRVVADPALKGYAENQPDYEQLYNDVLNGGAHSPDQQAAIRAAVSASYDEIDNVLRRLRAHTAAGISVSRVQELIGCFRGRNGETGGYFTLNQDLYLERHQYSRGRPTLPGLQVPTHWFQAYSADADRQAFQVRLQGAAAVSRLSPISELGQEIAYVKLHGSSNWTSAIRPQQMVIGPNKTGQIAGEPLLVWYFDHFRHALNAGNVRLMCIGYGFRDDHVNDVIADAISNAELRLYAMNPMARADFTANLSGLHRGPELVAGLQGYFAHGLLGICPDDTGFRTAAWEYLCDNYFEGRFKEVMGAA